jgi:hypothetical protein
MTDASVPLPTLVHVDQAFNTRLPTQRVMDAIAAAVPGVPLSELVANQTFQLTAFRALLRDFPDRDVTSLWMHAYDVEVQVSDTDPTNGNGATPSPPSAGTGVASPATSMG